LSALATAPRLFPEAPASSTKPRLARGPLTLEERLDRDLGAALAGRPAACPACGGPMRGDGDAQARCGDCGSALS
jgi:tRNA(Ile2) C34 agmatinyltransferase TiaS